LQTYCLKAISRRARALDALAVMKDADASLTHEQIMERIDEKRRSRSN
jgi:hypothetical protein